MTANLPARLDVISRALPISVPIPNTEIAAEVIRFRAEADKAVAVAERAEIVDADTAGRAADVLRAITTSEKKLDEARKEKTRPLTEQKAKIDELYKPASAGYLTAKTKLTAKVNVWRKAEEARLTAAAEVRRKERNEEAARLAAAQSALGDDEGADRILEEAAAMTGVPEKVSAVGVYGAVLGTTNRNVGEVNDRAAFLKVLATSTDPNVVAIRDKIEFPQALLNKLAAAVAKGESIAPVGFTAKVDDKASVR